MELVAELGAVLAAAARALPWLAAYVLLVLLCMALWRGAARLLGRAAGRLILALGTGDPVEPGLRKLPCQLVVRESCGGGPRS